jgi:hypothetical protein
MSLVHLYWVWATVAAQILRLVFLGFSLVLTFLIYPVARSQRRTVVPWYTGCLFLRVSPSSSIRITAQGIVVGQYYLDGSVGDDWSLSVGGGIDRLAPSQDKITRASAAHRYRARLSLSRLD